MKVQEKNKYKYLATNHRSKKYKSNWNGLPAFIKRYDIENSLANHFFHSIFWHIVLVLILWWLFSALKINERPIFKHKEKIQDIEFVIKNSSNRRPKLSKTKSTKTNIEKITNVNKNTASDTNINNNTNLNSDTKPNLTTNNKSKSAKKSSKNNFASIPVAIPGDFSVPMPKIKTLSSGSGGMSKRKSSSSGNSSDSFIPDIGSENGSPDGVGSSKGNGFDKNAVRNAVSTYDISPYVNELKRNVRMNWKPAKNSEGKYVELFLRIAKDGRLIILNVKKTSEVGEVDEAALNAVRRTLPLNPLPSKYGKSFLDLIFTFNSNTSSVGSRY